MARFDIVPFDSPHGGQSRILELPLNAAETFLQGEVVRLDADGNVTESGDDPTPANVLGIAATGGDTTSGTGTLDPDTGLIIVAGGQVLITIPGSSDTFLTSNFATDGAGTLTAPLITNIGDEAGFTLAAGVWSLDVGTTNNVARIVDVLDADGNSIMRSGGTGTQVVFMILASQTTSPTAPAAPGA